MPASLNEHTQFTDSSGKPLVSGKVYFGVQNADPTVSPITIYSDRELATPIANPQVLDSLGRTTNKVWVPGRYSMRVDDLNDSQIYQELDNGESADKGITVLENISGGNTIIATAASTITAYEDLEQYTFRTAQVNTGAVTLNIDTVGAKSVVKNHDKAILPGDFEADQNVIVSYNATDDVFEWTNQNAKVVTFYEGANVATATQPDIWVTGGNTFHFTGTTTVVDLANAPNVGARRTGIADAAFTLTHGSGITLQGGSNISIVAGDKIEFLADAVDAFSAWVTSAGGSLKSTQVFGYPTAYSDTFTTNFAGDANQLTIAGAPTQPFIIDKTAWRFTTSGTLPAGLSLATDYFIVTINSTTEIEVSETFGGTPITLTDDGTGTHTIAPLGIWTKEAGVNSVKARIVGSGAGAGGCLTGDAGSGGGAGGGAEGLIDVTGTSSETVTIPPGGLGGAAGSNDGADGSTSSLGALISATGGLGGDATTGPFAAGEGGDGVGGEINTKGGGGVSGNGTTNGGGGAGGNSLFGGGARGSGGTEVGQDAGAYGGGGGGATGVGAPRAGGNGYGGALVLEGYS